PVTIERFSEGGGRRKHRLDLLFQLRTLRGVLLAQRTELLFEVFHPCTGASVLLFATLQFLLDLPDLVGPFWSSPSAQPRRPHDHSCLKATEKAFHDSPLLSLVVRNVDSPCGLRKNTRACGSGPYGTPPEDSPRAVAGPCRR